MPSETVKDIDKEVAKNVLSIARGFEREHESLRDEHVLLKKKGELFFQGHQRIYYDALARDYRRFEESEDWNADEEDYNRVINIYRAHGESIIAALSIDVPGVNFVPDDPNSSDDVDTAANFSAAALLIQRHNKAELLYAHALYLAWISPLIAAYCFVDADKKYGEVKGEAEYDEKEELKVWYECKNGHISEFGTSESCAECGEKVEKREETQKVSFLKGYKKTAKTRCKIKLYGVDNVKVSPYARSQEDTPYLILEFEEHISEARERTGMNIDGSHDANNDRYARDPKGTTDDSNRVTTQCVWLRPSAYYYESLEIGDALKKEFPDGLYCEFVNDMCVEVRNENVDDFWTLWQSPVTSHIHMNPAGQPLFDVQEIENDIVNLAVDTMEQAIPETFADPQTVDFNKYGKVRRRPGMLSQAKALGARSLNDSFYTTKTASLSQEVDKLESKMDQKGQLVSAAFPSIYGGQLQGGSKTFAEYSASRQQALQRLSLIHKAATIWFAEVMSKAVPMYVESLVSDERYTVQVAPGEFLNKIIQADVKNGRIGHVEPSSSNQLPMSWGQQRDVVIQLLQMNNEQINAVLFAPENAHLMIKLSGLTELKIPGDESRTKQFREILLMIGQDDQEIDDTQEFKPESLPVDTMLEDHATEAQVCKTFLLGKMGQELKTSRPQVYANILQHMQAHMSALTPQIGADNQPIAPGQPSGTEHREQPGTV